MLTGSLMQESARETRPDGSLSARRWRYKYPKGVPCTAAVVSEGSDACASVFAEKGIDEVR